MLTPLYTRLQGPLHSQNLIGGELKIGIWGSYYIPSRHAITSQVIMHSQMPTWQHFWEVLVPRNLDLDPKLNLIPKIKTQFRFQITTIVQI